MSDLLVLGGGAVLIALFCLWIWWEYKRDTEK